MAKNPAPSSADPAKQLPDDIGLKGVSERKIKVHIANGHTKTLGLKSEPSRAGSYKEAKINDHIRKNKDQKSFTQNLFDTVAMKLLHRADSLDMLPPWAPSNEKTQPVIPSNLASNVIGPKLEGSTLKHAEEDTERPPIPDTESAQAGRGRDLPPIEIDPGIAFVEGKIIPFEVGSAQGMLRESANLPRDLENVQISDDDVKTHKAADIEAKDSTTGMATISSRFSQLGAQSEEFDPTGVRPLHKTSVSVASPFEPNPDLPAQSLSHFTSTNIIALRGAKGSHVSGMYEQHWLLRYLGRTDLPLRSSECGSYGDFLAYNGQSMIHILSNVDALLRSFLHTNDSHASPQVVWSYDFASMVDLFRKLRRIDMHPHKIFPSLWVSAGRLYPVSAATSKRRSLTAPELGLISLDPPSASQGNFLNDLEACHVVKIIMAALVGSVPKCSPMRWLAVRKLHASGQIAPFIDGDNSPAEQKMIGKLVKTLQAFENEMALSLVVRLARSIDIRYHRARANAFAEDSETSRRFFPPLFSRVIGYINASDTLKTRVADSGGHPSVKSGQWTEPEVGPITWHPKEWPIIIEWLRAVIVKEWDGNAKITKGSAVGGALGLLMYIRKQYIFDILSGMLSCYVN